MSEVETEESLHDQIQDMIVELGKLLGNISVKEYPLPFNKYHRKVDVVWKMNEQSDPRCVFEIHVKGDLDRSMTILKQARVMWNAVPVLVTIEEEEAIKAEQLLESSSPELRGRLKFMTRKEISEFLSSVKGLLPLTNRIDFKIVLRSRKWSTDIST